MTPMRWVILSVGDREYGIDAASVREVHDGWEALPMAGTAAWFLGTVVVRGRVLPVTSLVAWLDPSLPAAPPSLAVEVNVGDDAYLLAVPRVRHAMQTEQDLRDEPVPVATGPMSARGVAVLRRRIDGQVIETFSVAALTSASAFTDIALRPSDAALKSFT